MFAQNWLYLYCYILRSKHSIHKCNINSFLLYFNLISTEGYENLGIEEREEEYAWLEAIDQPDNLYMRSGIYTGSPVQACFSSSSHAV